MGAGTRGRPRPGIARRWCVPPAMVGDPGDTLDGECILAESPGDLGLLLWRTARDVALWAGTESDARGRLFAEGSVVGRLSLRMAADLAPKLSGPVDTLHGMLALGGRADAGIVSVCCLEVAAWARRNGLARTATAFAQAAALASPAFAEAALQVGIHARAAGQAARSGTWLRRAISLSRREEDGAAYSAALVELGELYEGQGDPLRAEGFYRRGFRASRRCAARRARMHAAHCLFRLARRRGDDTSAAQFALVAQRCHDAEAEGGPALLLDLARFWRDVGEAGRARAAVRRLVPVWERLPPESRLLAAALTARTRADAASPARGRGALRTAWSLMSDPGMPEGACLEAALDLLHAARIAADAQGFTRARRAVLRLVPRERFPALAAELDAMWPRGAPAPRLERAS
jgi:tetratricopeptide (TPR) repeat protein